MSAYAGADPGPRVFAAIDIGASGGRVMAGVITGGSDGARVELVEIHRFPNAVRDSDGTLRWDLTGLYLQILEGLRRLAARYPQTESIGIDTWAVDYGAVDDEGDLLAEPVAYRDGRTSAVIDDVHRVIGRSELYAINGLQYLPFNTIYQLAAERRGSLWSTIDQVLLIPDLIGAWLTGVRRTEITNASTTGLLDAARRRFATDLFDRLSLPVGLFPPLIDPGRQVGVITSEVARRTGLAPSTAVVAVGSHDTASAVVGIPARNRRIAYVSSGTWSLVGVELDEPVLTEAARTANFTNEGGVDGRVRFLRNVGGLWLLQESLRTWRESGEDVDLDAILADAAARPSGGPVVDVDAEIFLPPGDMPDRIGAFLHERGGLVPDGPAAVVRCILDSLAVAYAKTVDQAAALSGVTPEVVHIVGGGSRNELLCQLTADLSGLPVESGPVEATALGNLLVQARTAGALSGDLEDLRGTVRASSTLRRYRPARIAAEHKLSSSTR